LNEQTSDSSAAAAGAAPAETVAPAVPPAVPVELAPLDQRLGMVLAYLIGMTAQILGALVFWLVTKNDNDRPFVQDQAKEVLNFQLNVIVAAFVCGLLMFVIIGILLLPVVVIGAFVLTIIGAVKASKGESYRYPFIIRVIK